MTQTDLQDADHRTSTVTGASTTLAQPTLVMQGNVTAQQDLTLQLTIPASLWQQCTTDPQALVQTLQKKITNLLHNKQNFHQVQQLSSQLQHQYQQATQQLAQQAQVVAQQQQQLHALQQQVTHYHQQVQQAQQHVQEVKAQSEQQVEQLKQEIQDYQAQAITLESRLQQQKQKEIQKHPIHPKEKYKGLKTLPIIWNVRTQCASQLVCKDDELEFRFTFPVEKVACFNLTHAKICHLYQVFITEALASEQSLLEMYQQMQELLATVKMAQSDLQAIKTKIDHKYHQVARFKKTYHELNQTEATYRHRISQEYGSFNLQLLDFDFASLRQKIQTNEQKLNRLYEQHHELRELRKLVKHKEAFDIKIQEMNSQLAASQDRLQQMQADIDQSNLESQKLRAAVQQANQTRNVWRDNFNKRQRFRASDLTDQNMPTILRISNFPRALQDYHWHSDHYCHVLTHSQTAIVYLLLGKAQVNDDYLLKIGSSHDFLSRQILYRNVALTDDSRFREGTDILVADALLANDVNVLTLELFIRYWFENRYGHIKEGKQTVTDASQVADKWGNEWFKYIDNQQIDFIKAIFNYVDNHLHHTDELYQVLQHCPHDEHRYPYLHQQANHWYQQYPLSRQGDVS